MAYNDFVDYSKNWDHLDNNFIFNHNLQAQKFLIVISTILAMKDFTNL